MCAQVAPSGEYLRGHGRVAVDVTALRRLWQHSPVLGLVVLACVPVCAVLHDSLLWLRFVNLNKDSIIVLYCANVFTCKVNSCLIGFNATLALLFTTCSFY